ncbi:MAG: hypothetical protein J7K75_09455, partial [Desulfuromonas sp.]|nr:hypothetical protein [Desulfuromonas sp.]
AGFPDSNDEKAIGKPDAGKPHVRFDEGEQVSTVAGLLSTLLALLCRTLLVRHHCSSVQLTNHDSAASTYAILDEPHAVFTSTTVTRH